MSPDDLDAYIRSLGHTVEVITGNDSQPYTVVRDFVISTGSLAGRVCDVAVHRPPGVPYVLPAAIHTRPVLIPKGTRNTQDSPIGPEWQYWSRRLDRPPTPQAIWTHIATIFSEV
jgi:hypothetical protein